MEPAGDQDIGRGMETNRAGDDDGHQVEDPIGVHEEYATVDELTLHLAASTTIQSCHVNTIPEHIGEYALTFTGS